MVVCVDRCMCRSRGCLCCTYLHALEDFGTVRLQLPHLLALRSKQKWSKHKWSMHKVVKAQVAKAQSGQSTKWSKHKVVKTQSDQCTKWSKHKVVKAQVVKTQSGQSTKWSMHKVVKAQVAKAQVVKAQVVKAQVVKAQGLGERYILSCTTVRYSSGQRKGLTYLWGDGE